MNHVSDLTVGTVMGYRPCGWDKEHDGTNYTRQRVEELFAGRQTINILDVVEMDIPDADVVWLATRPGVISERARLLWLADCAESVLENYQKFAPGDKRVEECILVVRQYAWGQTDIQHVRSAARSSARSADSAAYSAAYSAASSARSAAYLAADSAAYSATGWAYLAAHLAARSADSTYTLERELQVVYLLDTLVELGEVEA